MILKIDLADLSVEVEEEMNLGELILALAKLYPEDQWKEVTLKAKYHIFSQPYTSPHTITNAPYMGTCTTSPIF